MEFLDKIITNDLYRVTLIVIIVLLVCLFAVLLCFAFLRELFIRLKYIASFV